MKKQPLTLARYAQAALIFVAFSLTGCASTRLVDAQVNSFAPQTVTAGSSYRFTRLPSQQSDPAQTQLEQLAQQALGKVGLKYVETAPLSVQVSAVQRQENSPNHSGMNIGIGLGWVFGNGAISIGNRGALFPGLDAQPSYWRQVSLIMRDATQTVVFESHATHDGLWSDNTAILAAMLDAALQGFPHPPAGVRRVNIEIPR